MIGGVILVYLAVGLVYITFMCVVFNHRLPFTNSEWDLDLAFMLSYGLPFAVAAPLLDFYCEKFHPDIDLE